MSDPIIVALITGSITLSVNLLSNWSARKKSAVEQARRDQKLDDQIATMNQKLDEHNKYSDKIANIEKAIVRIDATMAGLHNK